MKRRKEDWGFWLLTEMISTCLVAMLLQVSFLFLLLNSDGRFLLALKHSALISLEVGSFLLICVF